MERRVVAGVGLAAVFTAAVLAWVTQPDRGGSVRDPGVLVDAAPAPPPRPAAPAPASRPIPVPTPIADAPKQASPTSPALREAEVAYEPVPIPEPEIDPDELAEHEEFQRCGIIKTQGKVMDKLVRATADGNANADDRARMIVRMADHALDMVDEHEALRFGEVVCDDVDDYDLAPAASMLRQARQDLGGVLSADDLGALDASLRVLGAGR